MLKSSANGPGWTGLTVRFRTTLTRLRWCIDLRVSRLRGAPLDRRGQKGAVEYVCRGCPMSSRWSRLHITKEGVSIDVYS